MVSVSGLHKSIEGTPVLKGINFSLQDGETMTVIGKSGCGKSVLLKNIIGLMSPDAGRVVIDGTDVTDLTEREYNAYVRDRMSMVFQRGALWDSMTVAENIALALSVRQEMPDGERSERVAESLAMVGMEGSEQLYPEELSGGMMKRVAIARAVAARPKYLLYDEPTTGLDPVLSNVVNKLIRRLNRELGITALVVSHDVHYLNRFSDRVAMIHDGKIIVDSPVDHMEETQNETFHAFLRGETI